MKAKYIYRWNMAVRRLMGGFNELKSALIDVPIVGRFDFDDEEQSALEAARVSVLVGPLSEVSLTQRDADEVYRVEASSRLAALASLRLKRQDFKGAANACAKAINLFEGSFIPWLQLAEVLAESQDALAAKEALRIAEKLYEFEPDDPSVRRIRGIIDGNRDAGAEGGNGLASECVNCGRPLKSDAASCPSCGSSQHSDKERAVETSEDLYELLQVQPTAERKVISATYRRLCQRYDPERNEYAMGARALERALSDRLLNVVSEGKTIDLAEEHDAELLRRLITDRKEAEADIRVHARNVAARFADHLMRLSDAYEVLGNPTSRSAYDRSRGLDVNPPELDIYCLEWLLDQFRSEDLADALRKLHLPVSGDKSLRLRRLLSLVDATEPTSSGVRLVLESFEPSALKRVSASLGIDTGDGDKDQVVLHLSGEVRYIGWAERFEELGKEYREGKTANG